MPQSLTPRHITSWDTFCHALREHFYLSGYLQNLLAKSFQLRELSTQSVQGYIDVFCKLRIQLHINDPDMVLIIKFNSGLLLPLRCGVDLFEISSLDKAFLRALAVERKVSPRICYLQNRATSANLNPSHPQPYTSSSSAHKNVAWCTFHKTNSHNFVDCRAIKNICTNKTLVAEVTPTELPEQPC
jgi:hypothetical protein